MSESIIVVLPSNIDHPDLCAEAEGKVFASIPEARRFVKESKYEYTIYEFAGGCSPTYSGPCREVPMRGGSQREFMTVSDCLEILRRDHRVCVSVKVGEGGAMTFTGTADQVTKMLVGDLGFIADTYIEKRALAAQTARIYIHISRCEI